MTYSVATASARKSAYGRNQNTTYFQSSRPAIGPISHIIILVVIVSLMGLIYLTQVTKTYALGYRVDDLSKRQTQLTQEHSNLELDSVKLQSIEKVKSSQAAATLTTTTPSAYAQ